MREGGRKHETNLDQAWDLFESLAEGYDLWYHTPLGELVDTWEKEAVFALAEIRRGGTALDVGCGTGNYALQLARQGARTLGLDASATMLELARRKAREQSLAVEFIAGLVEELPFPDHTFDLVTCVTALEFTSSPKRALAEMLRTLKPGGRLVVGVLNAWSLWALARRLSGKESIYTGAHFFSPLELVSLLRPHGMVDWRTAVFVPPWCASPDPHAAGVIEFLGSLFLKPFGAFIAARVVKQE